MYSDCEIYAITVFLLVDVPLVLGFFGLIFITVLFGGLHMYLQTVYFFTLFVIFNIILVISILL